MDTNNKNNNHLEDNNIAPQDNNVAGNDTNTQNEITGNNNKDSFMKNVNNVVTKGEKIAETAINAADKAGEVGKTVLKTAGTVAGGAAKGVGILAKITGFCFNNPQLVGIVAAVLVVGYFLLFNPFGWNLNLFGKPQIEKTANIVEEVKKISEFTTACYYEESVIKNEKFTTEAQWFGNELDTINHSVVLTVMCKVRAGFDLSAISENDLIVWGDTVDIKLPAPKIFDVISNPSDYRIFEESGEWQHEEFVAMQKEGKKKMLQNALDQNILEKANTIGKERIKTLFTSFGFNVVNVTVTDVEKPNI